MNRLRLRKVATRVLVVILAIPAFGFAAIMSLFIYEMWTQASLGPVVESRFGFKLGTPYVLAGTESIEVMTISSVASDGAFDLAGVAEGEIVVSPERLGSFYRNLNLPAGEAVSFKLVDGGDGPPLDQRRARELVVVAP